MPRLDGNCEAPRLSTTMYQSGESCVVGSWFALKRLCTEHSIRLCLIMDLPVSPHAYICSAYEAKAKGVHFIPNLITHLRKEFSKKYWASKGVVVKSVFITRFGPK